MRESVHARLMAQYAYHCEAYVVDLDTIDDFLRDYKRMWVELWNFFPEDDHGMVSFPDRSPNTSELGCWNWSGPFNKFGYATSPEVFTIHRRLYEIFYKDFEPLGFDLQAHHRCENKRCINPHHIDPVTEERHREIHGIDQEWEEYS